MQITREYVNNFYFKFRKLEKLNRKLPTQIVALMLLRKANLSKHERMIVLTGVNLANKENMYEETKHSFMKFGDLMEEKAGTGPDVRLEPAWKKSVSSSYREHSLQHGSNGVMKKRLNPLALDGKNLCKSCGSYRHLVTECPDSWENMMKRKRVI